MNRFSALILLAVVLALCCEYGNACEGLKVYPITSDVQDTIVNVHNELRQKVASGQETRGSPGPQPGTPSGTMANLTWDQNLANQAASWAARCTFSHSGGVGQNIAGVITGSELDTVDWTSAINSWYDEVQDVDCKLVGHNGGVWSKSKRPPPGKKTGHYTQVVWETTTTIGCAAVSYPRDGGFVQNMICNYLPNGNRKLNGIFLQVYANNQNAACHGDPESEIPIPIVN